MSTVGNAGLAGPSTRRFLAADGVRGLAVLVVVVHNSAFIERSSTGFLMKLTGAVTATGWVGVELFFVLSGFLISGILLDSRGASRYFRNFYIRRVLRIFPLYYAVLFLALFVFPHVANVPAWTAIARENQWWFWSYLSNWGAVLGHSVPGFPHFWSLAVEEQFYLAWPLLVFVLSRRGMTALCTTMLAGTPLLRLALHQLGFSSGAGYELTVTRWDALAAGALLALLMREDPSQRLLAPWMKRITIASAGALALLTLSEHGFHADDVPVQVWGQSLIALLSTSLLYYCVTVPTGAALHVQHVMSAAWLRFFGKYSYAIYVFHVPIHTMLAFYVAGEVNEGSGNARFIKLMIYLACVLGLSTLAALVSWRVLEKPCLDLKDRLAPRLDSTAAATVSNA